MRELSLTLALIALGVGVALLGQPEANAQVGGGSLKVCRANNNAGRQVSWGCHSSQPCCFNEARNEGYCGPVGGRC